MLICHNDEMAADEAPKCLPSELNRFCQYEKELKARKHLEKPFHVFELMEQPEISILRNQVGRCLTIFLVRPSSSSPTKKCFLNAPLSIFYPSAQRLLTAAEILLQFSFNYLNVQRNFKLYHQKLFKYL